MKKIIFFMMFFVFNMTCFAAHLELEVIPNVYSNQVNLSTSVFFSSNQKRYIMDGKTVYCTSPGVDIMTREYNEFDNLSLSSINHDTLNKMRLIGYYGYDYPTHKSDRWFMASQELIWELLNQDVHFTTERYNTGNVINIDYEKDEIMKLVEAHEIVPSFAYEEVSSFYGDTIELIDTNNVLDEFDIVSNNSNIVKSGNRLTIKLDKVGSDTIHFVKKKYDNLTSKYYIANNSQDFMFFRPDDVTFDLKVVSYIPKSNISVYKKGEMLADYTDKFIYEEKGLTGVVFDVFAQNDIYEGDSLIYKEGDLVDTFETINGIGTSADLPNGSYILKETSTIDGFILSDEEIKVDLKNLEKENYIYMVDLNNDRQKIMLHLKKIGEEFDGIVDTIGKYNNKPLEGIEFGLYNGSPIYSYDNKLLVDKNTLIEKFTTDSEGVIKVELDIPYGTYYVKELSTLEGYKIDSSIYEFSVKRNGDETNILITKEPIVNELIKGNLVIHKMDTDGNNLSDVKFKIFDDYNNLIYEGLTDKDGLINIGNLGYGKYHFYETSAPLGFYVDDKIYEFVITDDNELINIKVVNEKLPITSNIYEIPKKLSTIGLGFGLATISLAIIYDKKYKNN